MELTKLGIELTRPFRCMPGPKPIPLFGNSWRFVIGKWRTRALDKVLWSLRNIAGFEGAAKVSHLFGHPDLVFPFNADDTASVYRKEDAMPHRAVAPCLRHYKLELRKDFFGEQPGLIGVHGEPWSKFRSRVSRELVVPEAARQAVPALNEVAEDFITRINKLKDNNNELPNDFLNELYKWALESVGTFALGTRIGCLKEKDDEAKQIISSIHGFFHSVPELELSAPVWRIFPTRAYHVYIKALDTFRNLCLEKVKSIKGGACGRVAEKTDDKTAAILALDLLLVGVDTTAAAAASAIYLLSTNRRVQAKLQEEIDHVIGKETKLTWQHLDRLHFVKACIKETLRMKPVILGNGRCIQTDTVISGYKVPKGSHIVFPHFIHSHEEKYFPEPEKFVPERWLRNQQQPTNCAHLNRQDETDRIRSKQHSIGIHPFASLPFGFGRRMCIGKRFAEAELTLLITKMFQHYDISWHQRPLTYDVTPTYVPNEPLRFTVKSRKHI